MMKSRKQVLPAPSHIGVSTLAGQFGLICAVSSWSAVMVRRSAPFLKHAPKQKPRLNGRGFTQGRRLMRRRQAETRSSASVGSRST